MGRWSGALSDSALADSPHLFQIFSEISRYFQRVPGFDFEVIPGFPKVKSLRYVQKSYRCCVFLRVCGSVEHFYDFQRCSEMFTFANKRLLGFDFQRVRG